jgi:hypothetical protein
MIIKITNTKINTKRLSYHQQQELIDYIMDSRLLNQAQEKNIFDDSKRSHRKEIKPSKLNNLEKRSDLTVNKISLKKKQPIKQPLKTPRMSSQ